MPYWKIHHAYRTRKVPEPARFNNQRRLVLDDLRLLAEHFGVPMPQSEADDHGPGKESGAA